MKDFVREEVARQLSLLPFRQRQELPQQQQEQPPTPLAPMLRHALQDQIAEAMPVPFQQQVVAASLTYADAVKRQQPHQPSPFNGLPHVTTPTQSSVAWAPPLATTASTQPYAAWAAPLAANAWRTRDNRPICFACGGPGHISRYCRRRVPAYTDVRPRSNYMDRPPFGYESSDQEVEVGAPSCVSCARSRFVLGRRPLGEYRSAEFSSSDSHGFYMAWMPSPASPANDVDREEAQQGANAIGDGDFQRFIFSFTNITRMGLLCHSNVVALIKDPLDHWCKPPPDHAGMLAAQWKNVGIFTDEAGRFSQCRAFVRPGSASNDTETVPCDSWDDDPFETRRRVRSYWDLVCQRSWLLPLGNDVFRKGALIMVLFMDYLADRKGCKPVIVLSSFVLLVSAIASCFADAYPAYLALIYVDSACASTVHIVTTILLFEVSPVKYGTFYQGLCSFLGVVFVELPFVVVTTVRITWLTFQLLIVAPTLLLLSATFTMYESPMWLLAMSRLKKAERVIYITAKMNEMLRIHTKKVLDRIQFETTKASEPHAVVVSTKLLLPGLRRGRDGVVSVTTLIVMPAFYSLTCNRRLGGSSNLVVRVIYVVALVPTYGAMYAALNAVGRLHLMLLLFALLGGVSELYGITTYEDPREVGCALAIANKLVISATVPPPRYTYMAELFPSSVRSAVMCGAYTCGRVSAVFAYVLAPFQDVGHEELSFAFLAIVVFRDLVVLLSLPETTIGGAVDVAVTTIYGNRRDFLGVAQNSLITRLKRRKIRRRPASIASTVDCGVGSPKR
ncbi:hypothetical protein HPB51_025613 [Rhipicephalus microplus]|uniref:CCHC-type domain-containing protein n=1 Tax=Rhipicephalus microplus TaxID=6941 RepID=A0A9J6D854_RHIMP|nr:hypothetical protein HPB51_025613 [Rhipicephalus microplus]